MFVYLIASICRTKLNYSLILPFFPSPTEKYTLQLQQSIYTFLRAIEILGEKEYTTAFNYLSQTVGDFFKYLLSDPSNLVCLEQVSDEWRFTAETTPTKLDHVPLQVVLHILGQCQESLGIIAKFVFEENTAYVSRLGSSIWDDIANSIHIIIFFFVWFVCFFIQR
jgi:hypothetical protein